jgi:hypothetical protein
MRQVLSPIDLRTWSERQGITRTQQTAQAIANILQTVGAAEQKRRERQTLDRITRAIAGGATLPEAVMSVGQEPEFGAGITGALQRFGGMFQPSPGGMDKTIQQAIIGQTDPLYQTRLKSEEARLEYWKRPRRTQVPEAPLSEPQLAGYGEAMDARIKRVDKFRPGMKDFSEADLFREWQKFLGMYKFKNDTQREQIWNVWKNKLNNLGKEVEWDPADPKWTQAIGLSAEQENTTDDIDFEDSVKFQSAPHIKLDPYWDKMTPEERKTAWDHIQAGGSVDEIIKLLK